MRLKLSVKTLGALIVALAIPASAAFEDAFYSARSAAMGGAMTAITDDSVSLFYNPAGLGQVKNPRIDANYLQEKNSPAGAVNQRITDGTAIIPASGDLHGAFGLAGLYNQDNSFSGQNRQIKLGYGSRGLWDSGSGTLDLGGALNYLDESFQGGGPSTARADVDLGILYRFGDRYSFGASILNLGQPDFHYQNTLTDRAPTTFRAGFSESIQGYTVALDGVSSQAAGMIPALAYAALGMERWIPTAEYGSFAARAGLNLGNQDKTASLGVGWRIMGAEADYAMMISLGGSPVLSHAISLAFRFGVSDPEGDFERILKEELAYRKELSQALEAGEVRQWQLKDELTNLKAQLDALKTQLADKNLSAQEAEAQLKEIGEKYHAAMGKFEKIKSDRERAAKMSDQDRFQQDWVAYEKLKTNGAPDSILIGEVKRILRAYQDKKADLSPANRELLRLLGGR